MSQISIEFQKTIQDKINAAWKAKKYGDCFMQKNNFAEIIVVHKYDLEEMELQGWVHFSLACLKNPLYIKPEIKPKEETKKDSPYINTYVSYGVYDFPDAP